MGSTKEKLAYLDGTKTAIKNAIESCGLATIGAETTFRQYADLIKKACADFENKISAVITEVKPAGAMVTRKTSVSKGATTVLNITGAGELHVFLMQTQNISDSKNPDSFYAKVTFDGSFTMFIPCGGYDDNNNWVPAGGCFTVFDYLKDNNSGHKALRFYFAEGDENENIQSMSLRAVPYWNHQANMMTGNTCNPVSESEVLKDSYLFIGSHKPLRFDESLKIEVFNSTASGSAAVRMMYKLK